MPPTAWEKIFSNDTFDKGLMSKIYKEQIQLNINKPTQLKNSQRTGIDLFSKEDI